MKERIKALCKEKHITIQKLEKELGFGNGTIGKWDDSFPKSDLLAKVADYFGVSVDYLLGREAPTNQDPTQPIADEEAIKLARQIKDLPPDVRENIEQQIKIWHSLDKK